MTGSHDTEDISRLRTYSWCFTINNYTDEDIARLDTLQAERIVVGKEVAPTTGTPHLQGYVRFKKACRFSWWKNNFPRASVQKRRGTETQAAEYCKKEGNVVIDRGYNYDEQESVSCKRPRDEVASQVLDDIDNGANYGVLRQKYRVFCFWNRRNVLQALRDHQHYKNNPEAPDPIV